jgi:hypothetical protein
MMDDTAWLIYYGYRTCERIDITKEEWQELHDPEKSYALTVTKLVEYMGLGYDAPWKVCKKKERNDFVKSLLDYGRNMEEIAAKVIPLFAGHYDYEWCDIPKKNEILCSVVGENLLTDEYRKRVNSTPLCLEKERLLYGSPDLILCKRIDPTKRVVEIKCPRDSICLASVRTQEDIIGIYKEKAYINSKNPRILKKLLGHMVQAALYAFMMNSADMEEECTLMYFYPDVVSNKYLIISYDIDWPALLDWSRGGWNIDEIIKEYYQRFLQFVLLGKKDETLKAFRNGVYPLLDDDDDKKLKVKDIISKGIARTRMLIAGGESTKEITSYALDQFLPGQKEQIPLEC